MDGCALGTDDGIGVGQFETEGFFEGWRLGWLEWSLLGWLLGLVDGTEEGWDDAVGCNEG